MASGETTSTVQCPQCKEPVAFPVSFRHLSTTELAISFDLALVREHIASHEARYVTELPPTAR
jgi:hypothetical protein